MAQLSAGPVRRRVHARAAASLAGAALAAANPAAAGQPGAIERGAYLVNAMGCADCHMPMKPGPEGPVPDLARGLSGHPAGVALPPAPAASGPWLWGGAATNTAFWGPWGVSFASNLTPDRETGIGAWRVEDFIATLRGGRHPGTGRTLLPPMPWPAVGRLDDRDLRAVFAYLQSRPPVANRVPAPRPPQTARR